MNIQEKFFTSDWGFEEKIKADVQMVSYSSYRV